ncbi:MAG: peptide deformylase, partial [Candidatus Daviesbacteria bacterium]|nr:peptide deformylase [Candidatus Daviesbacteria bacterium]
GLITALLHPWAESPGRVKSHTVSAKFESKPKNVKITAMKDKNNIQVIRAPDNRLRVKTKRVNKVTPELIRITEEMVKLTKTFKDPEGVGLASTQIGRDEKLFVAKNGKDFSVFINPKIVTSSKKTKIFFEGCLSIPNYYGEIERPISVTVSYEDEKGVVQTKKLTGLLAWVFQHEVDHLEGTLFVDRVLNQKGRMFKVVGKDRSGGEVFEEVTPW